jgi:hypothetical protein
VLSVRENTIPERSIARRYFEELGILDETDASLAVVDGILRDGEELLIATKQPRYPLLAHETLEESDNLFDPHMFAQEIGDLEVPPGIDFASIENELD